MSKKIMDKDYEFRKMDLCDLSFVVTCVLDGESQEVFPKMNTPLERYKFIFDSNVQFYILEKKDRRYIGCGAIKDKGEVCRVFIKPEYRKDGYGTIMSILLKEEVFSCGNSPYCFIRKQNTDWIKHQEKLGMKVVSETVRMELVDNGKYAKALEKIYNDM